MLTDAGFRTTADGSYTQVAGSITGPMVAADFSAGELGRSLKISPGPLFRSLSRTFFATFLGWRRWRNVLMGREQRRRVRYDAIRICVGENPTGE